jgi:proteic killer suppression protein
MCHQSVTYVSPIVKYFSLEALFLLPSNKAHALGGTRDNQYAIWINNQWRLCFCWKDGHVEEVEVVDYH